MVRIVDGYQAIASLALPGPPDSRAHEAGRSQRGAERVREMVGADLALPQANQADRLEPHVHRNVAGFEHRADLDREGFAAPVALVDADPGGAPLELSDARVVVAARADRTIRPDTPFDELIRARLVEKRFLRGPPHRSSPLTDNTHKSRVREVSDLGTSCIERKTKREF